MADISAYDFAVVAYVESPCGILKVRDRRKSPRIQQRLPGGKIVRSDPSLEHAVARELGEKTGIMVPYSAFCLVCSCIQSHGRMVHLFRTLVGMDEVPWVRTKKEGITPRFIAPEQLLRFKNFYGQDILKEAKLWPA